MGLFFNRAQAGKDYCIYCGNTIVQGSCEKCGREAKPMVKFDRFAYRPVPPEAAEELGEQEKKLFGNPKYDVQEMIKSGKLYVADILFDSTLTEERDAGNEEEERMVYNYFVQFSTPEGDPCSRRCEVSSIDHDTVESFMRQGKREGLLFKGTKKNKDYYYPCVIEDENIGKMLRLGVAKKLMNYGREDLSRRLPPEGGDRPEYGRKTFDLTWEEAVNGEETFA